MTDQATDTVTAEPMPDREEIRAQLEAAREQFTSFVRSLTADDWERATPNPAWNVRQLMYHTAWSCGQLASTIAGTKKGAGKGGLVPHALINPASMLITKWGARGGTPASVCALYERGHAAALRALDGVRDDEWQRGATNYGTYSTVADTFKTITGHSAEHIGEVRQALDRT
jgi:hypothetical protein